MIVGIGQGIYTVTEASRLTGVSAPRIRRWLRGYRTVSTDPTTTRPPVFRPEYGQIDGTLQLSFLDLIEVRVIDGLREMGVPWREIRRAEESAAELLKSRHPFATHSFLTDGREIFTEIREDSSSTQLVRLSERQQMFRAFVRPYLRGIEFDRGTARRWWPLGERRRVVIDPARTFGHPIGVRSGVPTELIARFASSTAPERAAAWYEVELREVRDAIKFERELAA